jgi:plastocyanin
MRKIVVTLIAAALAGGVLSACGSSSSSKAKAGNGTAKAPAGVVLQGNVTDKGQKTLTGATPTAEIEQDDFYFNATFLKADPGATVTVELKNEGKNQHTFTIDSLGIDKVLNPDGKATVQVKIPATGQAAFYCRFHKANGMQGAFYTGIATSGSSATTPTTTATPATTASSSGRGY